MSTNEITGDSLCTKVLTGESKRKFDENFERIFNTTKPSWEDWDDDQESRVTKGE